MLTLTNTLTRKKEPFIPIEPGKIRMYVCGMTTYDYCHIGHARMLVAFDIIYRWFLTSGYETTYVRNITDIDDKIIKRAAENGETIQSLTGRFIQAMEEDITALNALPPTVEPRATAHIASMIEMIETLISNGKAYPAANGDVYYAVREFPAYGRLSGKTLDSLRAGERVEIEEMKHDPLDFALWKAAKAGEPAWDSPWGKGRPGWHIECSAMSCDYLGEHFDIHGGGADLQFPHHENEIAQSEGAHNETYVNYWLHNGFITVDGVKMSKSLGNFFTIRDVLETYDGETIRCFIARSHYRSAVNFTRDSLVEADQLLERLYLTLRNIPPAETDTAISWESPYAQKFKAAMDDDFNTPTAMAVLLDLSNEANKQKSPLLSLELKQLANTIGFLTQQPEVFLQTRHKPGHTAQDKPHGLSKADIEALITDRNTARSAKNWAESDRIRDELAAQGILLEDSPQGTTWRRA